MKTRKWTAKQKFQIVMEGLTGKSSVSDICAKHSVNQSQYYKWRDQFLQNATKAFETDSDKQVEQLKKELKSRNKLVGQLMVELKKTEIELAQL